MSSAPLPDPDERLSALFDGEISGENRGVEGETGERQQDLLQQWSQLRDALQQLPATPVNLVAAVRDDLNSTVQRPPASGRWSQRTLMLGLSGLAVACLACLFPLLQTVESPQQLARVDTLHERIGQLPSTDWQVVVVNVADDTTVDASVQAFLGEAEQRGVGVTSLQTPADSDAEYSAGVLLMGGTDSLGDVNSFAMPAGQLDWNPGEIDEYRLEEIRQIFVSSQKSPSQSERLFGAMYIVDHDGASVREEPLNPNREVADISSDVTSSSPPAAVRVAVRVAELAEPVAALSVPVADQPLSAARAPVVIIFRKLRSPADSGRSASPEQGGITPVSRDIGLG